MTAPLTYVTIPASSEVADQLPSDAATRAQVLELGLREWRIRQTLEDYRLGRCSLAAAAEQARVPLRELIALAFAYGLSPQIDPAWLEAPLSLEQAQEL